MYKLFNSRLNIFSVLVAAIGVFFYSNSFGNIIIFNDNVIGKNIDAEIQLTVSMGEKDIDSVQPSRIVVTIKDGKYIGAEVNYLESDVNMSDFNDLLDKKYKSSKYTTVESENFKVWRISDKKITITLSEDESCEGEDKDRFINVIYGLWRNW